MRKDIEIDGKVCHFKTSAAVPRIYRIKFGRDLFVDMDRLKSEFEIQDRKQSEEKAKAEAEGREYIPESSLGINSLEMFENIAYVMHKHGDPDQPNDINEWLDQFETFDIYTILPDIFEMWKMENLTTSLAKKKQGQ
jgi:hypothetical protein